MGLEIMAYPNEGDIEVSMISASLVFSIKKAVLLATFPVYYLFIKKLIFKKVSHLTTLLRSNKIPLLALRNILELVAAGFSGSASFFLSGNNF